MTRTISIALAFLLTACAEHPTDQVPLQVNWKPGVQTEVPDESTSPLEFMVAPWLSTQELTQIYTPLLKHLGTQLGQAVRLNVAPDYPTLLRLIQRGKVDIAQVNARSLQSLIKQPSAYRYVGTVKHLNSGGDLTYGSKGMLFATKSLTLNKSEASRLRLGLIDKRSTSGYLLPKIWLGQRGVKFTDFQDVLFLGSHTRAFTALFDKRVDVIASWNGQLILEEGRMSQKLFQLAETGTLPNDAWVTAGPHQDELQDKVRAWAHTLPNPSDTSELFTRTSAFAGLKETAMDSYLAIPKLVP